MGDNKPFEKTQRGKTNENANKEKFEIRRWETHRKNRRYQI